MRENYDNAEESSKFLLGIVTLVSSVNKMGFDKVCIVGGRSLKYTMESKGPKIVRELHVY
jgi:hypothetical protein